MCVKQEVWLVGSKTALKKITWYMINDNDKWINDKVKKKIMGLQKEKRKNAIEKSAILEL